MSLHGHMVRCQDLVQLVTYRLNVKEGAELVKQVSRNFRIQFEVQIKHEIHKLSNVGFVKSIQHLKQLADIVPIKKNNEQIKCCTSFQDLNKMCPKDEFRLLNIDIPVDATVGNSMFSFMDDFSGYNHIKMDP